ncbi:phenylacetate-CoA ligase [Luteibacter sp. Sphag1AF]|uniref:phenylacetate--CoA ligase family protein n=1 Tax=Luteibacter sp. Sphag1AF TaxID=2587031 RepID=UPI00161E0D8E|nr:phenylacetate--CoA ligase family protein [Luteibacter sp. Sphag1AF]MBB3228580.1 phenylacetate-CoA ligase [Luteibacter sp. Sphag1AF]
MNTLYEHAFRHVLFPAYEKGLRRRHTLDYMKRYEADQWLDPERLAALQWERLRRLLEHCAQEVPYYRRRWRELGIQVGDLRNLADFSALPVLDKAEIRAHFDEFKADSLKNQLLYKATGGSTGEPLRFGYTRESNDRRIAVMWRGYGWAGARMGRRTLFLWGGSVGEPTRAHRMKDRIYNAAFGRRMLNTFRMSESTMSDFADQIDRYRPAVLVGYVGALYRLAEWLIATGRRVYAPESIIAAAETLHDFQRDAMEEAFGAPVFNTYGCREFMLIAAECEHHSGLHINADHLLVELAGTHGPVPPGQTGTVVVTDLSNYGMPLLRYGNGDMATSCTQGCPCGRGLPLLARVDGRILDVIRTADGRVLPGEFFPHMLKDVPGVTRFQLVQKRLDRLDLAIVRNAAFNDASLAYIQREIDKVLGQSVELHYHFPDDIPLTRSGKLRVTISEL